MKVQIVSELYNENNPSLEVPAKPGSGDVGLTKGSPFAFCFDVRSNLDVQLPRGYQCKIPTGIYSSLPVDTGAILRERSGLADRGIRLGAGTIDCDYRGQWLVLLRYEPCIDVLEPYRSIPDVFKINRGDRICQVWFAPCFDPVIEYLSDVHLLAPSVRGMSGFGSTGMS